MKTQIVGAILLVLILGSISAPLVSADVSSPSEHQSSEDVPTQSNEGSFTTSGAYLKIGIDSYAHYGDFSIGCGFQYPHGYEHAAVAWWGEGFTFGYLVNEAEFVATSYESGPFWGLSFVSETLIRDDADEAVYEVVLRTADNRVELVHNFRFPKATKFVILNVTIRNLGPDTLSGVRYRRVWDFDMDNTVDGSDGFDVDLSRNMLYSWEMHYAALAASSLTPPSEWDVYAWDDLETYLPGYETYTGPFPTFGDYCVRLEWIYESIPPNTSISIVMYHIGGDNKDDLDDSYAQAEAMIGPAAPQIFSVSPNYGGNTGTVTVKIRGIGFSHCAIPKLMRRGFTDIIGLETTLIGTTLIVTTFNLTGAEQGAWDLAVTFPDGTELTLEKAFTIFLGGEPIIYMDIIGRDQIRVGQTGTYFVRIYNKGTINSDSMLVDIKAGERVKVIRVETTDGIIIWDRAAIEEDIEKGKEEHPELWEGVEIEEFLNKTLIWIPTIEPGGFIEFKLTVYAKAPWEDDDLISIVASIMLEEVLKFLFIHLTSQLYYVAKDEIDDTVASAILRAFKQAFEQYAKELKSRLFWSWKGIVRFCEWLIKALESGEFGKLLMEFGVHGDIISKLSETLAVSLEKITPMLKVGKWFYDAGKEFSYKSKLVKDQYNPPESKTEKPVTPVWAWDPNAKATSTGYGSAGYIPPDIEMEYIIYFENLENATAPAQRVTIVDSLDSCLDWESFCWEEVSFSGRIIPPDQEYIEIGPDLQVRIRKTIDKTNGIVTWTFETINSTTGLPPEDPMIGFLPPNKNPPEGEGWVKYRIKVKPGTPHKSEIHNKAIITFDENPPVETNDVFNTVDSISPESYVLPLPPESPPSFIVNWTGNDDGSGIKDYTIWFSKDGGPWVIWLPLTRETSALFVGEPGHTYAFYSIAHDNVGNKEEPPETPDAVTTILADDKPPETTMVIGSPHYADLVGNLYVSSNTPITLTAEDNPGGTGVASTFYRISNDTYYTDWAEYLAPFYLAGLSDGEYLINYYSIDYIGNAEPTKAATVILDNTPPKTTLTISEPKYVSCITYVTPDTPFILEAEDAGAGVNVTNYRIYNSTYDSGWITYTGPFSLASLTDGTYTIEYYSIDNVQNAEATQAINVTLFSWNYIFEDTYGRGTVLKINLAHNFIQFITPDKDYGIRNATYMRICGRAIIIRHYDNELRLVTIAVDTKLDLCIAIALDKQTHKQYFLIDKAGKE